MPRIASKKNEYQTTDFIKYIRDQLRINDKSYEEVAGLLGITRQTVYYKFKSESFSIGDIIKIIHFLNIPAEEIGRRLTYE